MLMMLLVVLSAVLSDVTGNAVRGTSNVCRSFRDYADIFSSINCYYNPDAESTPTEIARRYGYELSTHEVTTEDGYMLSMFRVYKNDTEDLIPVIVQHGILVDGLSWIVSGEKSLGFILANAGFDVWLPNLRGTQYSSNHIKPGISEKEYWNFSFHEMAIYDIPAFIEYIAKYTNKTENGITYMGHSLGSTVALIYASNLKQHSDKYLNGMILLAPAAYMVNLRGGPQLLAPFFDIFKNVLEGLGMYSIGHFNREQRVLLKRICGRFPLIIPCQIIAAVSTGLVVEQVRPELFPVFFLDFPNGCGLKTISHYIQIYRRGGRFQQYDFGSRTNMLVYNSTVPPEYPVEKITLPTQIFYGDADFIVTAKSVEYLYNRLKCPKSIHRYNLAHNDFAYGKQLDKVYHQLVDVIKNEFVNRTI